MINGVHHVSIATTDHDAMLAFYQTLLGLDVCMTMIAEETDTAFQALVGLDDAAFRGTWLKAGNIQIEFFTYLRPAGKKAEPRPACDAGIRHICFDISDLAAEYTRLKAAGVKFISEPQYMAEAKVLTVYARDPDGNIVELQEIFEGSPLARIESFSPLN
jgi:catechol 2,3-dioxygenase-like lactoylglutathione lyase family enzyme